MTECIFCAIASGEVDATLVAEDEDWVAFRDLSPQAPTHVLVVPRIHVPSLSALADVALAGSLVQACARVARSEGLEGGYRVVANAGADGGQAVPHLHFHVLGGRPMGWPPG